MQHHRPVIKQTAVTRTIRTVRHRAGNAAMGHAFAQRMIRATAWAAVAYAADLLQPSMFRRTWAEWRWVLASYRDVAR